jgi:hypothetical protein
MSFTREDLILEALDILGVLSTGQPAEVEDINRVGARVESTMAKLSGLEIVTVGDVEAIPDEWFDDLAAILAHCVMNKFGLTVDDQMRLEKNGLGSPPGTGSAALSLKQQTRGKPTGEVEKTEFF